MEQQRPHFLTSSGDQHKAPSFVSAKVPLSTDSLSRVRFQHLLPGTRAVLYCWAVLCSSAPWVAPVLAAPQPRWPHFPANSHTHQAQVTEPGLASKSTQLVDCSWFTARLKPWQNKGKPTATDHPGPHDSPKKGR